MSRGGNAGRTIAERSAAAAKGWASRKRRAAAPAPGSQQDRVVAGPDIAALLQRIRDRLDPVQ